MSHHNGKASACDWRTPLWLVNKAREVFDDDIYLDPASSHDNPTGALMCFTERGLEQSWEGFKNIFLNHPWSRKEGMPSVWWMAPLWSFALDHPDVHIFNVGPASLNATWWHDFVAPAPIHCLPRGRVKYDPPPGHAPASAPTFDTCVSYWGPDPERFRRVMADVGRIFV